jgi:PBP1b-binding outer membrane lipoprotein LpoB
MNSLPIVVMVPGEIQVINLKPLGRIIKMNKKHNSVFTRYTFFLVALLLMVSCSPEMVAEESQISKLEEKTMLDANVTDTHSIPPIDKAAPSNFESASFGLG